MVEPYDELNLFHSRWIKPIGERASNNIWGWSNAEYDQIVEEMQTIQPGAERQHELFRRALEIRLQELPIISLTGRPSSASRTAALLAPLRLEPRPGHED